MSAEDELIAIRLELKGQGETVAGIKETVEAEKGLGKQTERTAKAADKGEESNLSLGRAYSSMGAKAKIALGFLGVAGVFEIEKSIKASEELSKTTTGLSRNLGLATNVASRWGAVAYSREIDPKALGMSFSVLSSKLVEAGRKGGTALTPFHQLGITQEEAEKGGTNFQWGLMRVVKALGEEEGGAKRATAAKAVLGKGYATLLPLFSEGTKGLKEQLHWADEYGVTLSGSTNEGLQEMVKSQRELKVASLGVEVAMTKALQPAIEAGEDQVKEFIKTINDPNLSAEQKIDRIEGQFENLEADLIRIIEKALPGVAEHAGQLGLKIAGAVWHGFENSSDLGKLAIGGWLFLEMGGFSAIAGAGAKVGGRLAVALGTKFLETVAPYFAAEMGVEGLGSALSSQMGGLRTLFATEGTVLGTVMGVAAGATLAGEVYFAYKESENIAGLSLINTPKLGATSSEEETAYLGGLGYTALQILSPTEVEGFSPTKHKHVTFTKGPKGWKERVTNKIDGPGGAGVEPGHKPQGRHDAALLRPIVVHTHVNLDGREVAHNTTQHAEDEAALR